MKANELRIGNLVIEDGVLCEVTSISISGQLTIFSAQKVYSSDISKIVPIPLTEEWLLKLGFEGMVDYASRIAAQTTGYKTKESVLFRFNDNRLTDDVIMFPVLVFSDNIFRYRESGLIIKYVHQLQNLYFALTGQELEIK